MSPESLFTVVAMAVVTYLCRVGGFLLLRDRAPSPRLARFLASAPKTMFVALIAPALVAGGAHSLIAAAVTLATMLWRRNLLLAMACGTVTMAVLRAA